MKIMAKLAVIGDGGVGKTSYITTFTSGRYSADYKMTIGVDTTSNSLWV